MKALARGAGLGFALGAGWGVLARIWMRLITTDPEFSWGGTLSIVVFAALLGAGVGVVDAALSAGRSPWWTLAIVPGLVLFLSPGMVLLPCFALGGLAWGAQGRALQVVGALALLGSLGLGAWVQDATGVVFVVGYLALAAALGWAGTLVWWRPSAVEGHPLGADRGVVTVTRVHDRVVGQGEEA